MMSRQSNFQCRSPILTLDVEAARRTALAKVYQLLLAQARVRHPAGRNHQEAGFDMTRDTNEGIGLTDPAMSPDS